MKENREQLGRTQAKRPPAKRHGSAECLTLDLQGVAVALGLSRTSTHRLWKAGSLPPTLNLAGVERRLWAASVVRRWIEMGCPPAAGQGSN